MALIRVDFRSEELMMDTGAMVILPEDMENSRAKVLYLLHGLTDNCTGWARYSNVERYARERKMAVVMPEVQRSFYIDMAYGVNYFSYVAKELPEKMHKLFGLSNKREKNFVAGLSMGGYGALKCALTNPGQYAGCGAFSSACDMVGNVQNRYTGERRRRELQGFFGVDLQVPEKDDVFALVEKAADAPLKPKFFVTCGTEDTLLEQNRALRDKMEKYSYDLRYMEWPGGHKWDFWDRSILLMLEYFVDRK